MDETLDYFWFAKQFGWTPTQVDDLPVFYRERFAAVGEAQVRAVERRQAAGR